MHPSGLGQCIAVKKGTWSRGFAVLIDCFALLQYTAARTATDGELGPLAQTINTGHGLCGVRSNTIHQKLVMRTWSDITVLRSLMKVNVRRFQWCVAIVSILIVCPEAH